MEFDLNPIEFSLKNDKFSHLSQVLATKKNIHMETKEKHIAE